MTAAAFNLTNTQIVKTEHANCDTYMGRLGELLAVGIVQADQLPTGRVLTISWSHGRQVKTRCVIDAGYLRVRLDKTSDLAWISLGISRELQQARKQADRAQAVEATATRPSTPAISCRAQELAEAKEAAKLLAEIPATQSAFLREVAHFMREFVVLVASGAANASSKHGYRITSESLDNIHDVIDALTEQVLRSDVEFDAEQHARAVDLAQRRVIVAVPRICGQLLALCEPRPWILQGEQA